MMTRSIPGRRRLLAAAVGTGAAAYSLVVMLVSLSSASHATAWTATATSFGWVSAGSSDQWLNYDFQDDTAHTASNVDWPVRFLFDTNAEVDKVKDTIDGCHSVYLSPQLCDSASAKAFYGKENNVVYWDYDSGRKGGLHCQLDMHMRVYAVFPADRNYDPNLGYYVLATVHKDLENGSCQVQYYSAEGEQSWWDTRISAIPGWTDHANISYWYNYEPAHWADAQHWVQSDGYTSYIDVP
jgi:hypothetical protein